MISLTDWTNDEKRRAWLKDQPDDVNRLAAACFAALADRRAASPSLKRTTLIRSVLRLALGIGTRGEVDAARKTHWSAYRSAYWSADRSAYRSADGSAYWSGTWSATHALLVRVHSSPMAFWRVLHRLHPEAMPLALLDLAETPAGCVLADRVAEFGESAVLAGLPRQIQE